MRNLNLVISTIVMLAVASPVWATDASDQCGFDFCSPHWRGDGDLPARSQPKFSAAYHSTYAGLLSCWIWVYRDGRGLFIEIHAGRDEHGCDLREVIRIRKGRDGIFRLYQNNTITGHLHGQKVVMKGSNYPDGWFGRYYKDLAAELPQKVRRLFGDYYGIH